MSYRETSTGTGREAHVLRVQVGRVFLVGPMRRPSRRYPQRVTDHTFGALASQRSRSDILSKHKIFHCFMHMRAKTICGF